MIRFIIRPEAGLHAEISMKFLRPERIMILPFASAGRFQTGRVLDVKQFWTIFHFFSFGSLLVPDFMLDFFSYELFFVVYFLT